MAIKQKVQLSVASIALSAVGLGALPLSASAMNFVPQQQGEINVGLGCLENCLELNPVFDSIVSLTDDTSGTRSRLFVDYFGDSDTKQTYGQGTGYVEFKTKDAGTNSAGFWFRPSEVEADGSNEEKGQLEVGTYLFNFAQELEEITIDFFDTESKNTTGVLAINGEQLAAPDYVSKGKDGNIFSQTFYNVSSLELKLGYDNAKQNKTGDGVNFQMRGTVADTASVPEPATLLGLLAIAGAGLSLRKKAEQDIA
ncbi:MAG: LEVG family PEP-CTERM protein [Leptolyngbyaceae cyanobacterium]